ncbi:MAG TPA: M20/M25/M40 family metallo-hydrolase [Desulfobacteria bacterium]|nr:M20/M25/M40 family metallo-hydrolase [Desulfobacteria bacterium]
MVNTERLIQEFIHLVRIPSPTLTERAIADYLTSRLKKLGFEVKEDRAGETIGGQAGNLIATLPGKGPNVMFCAHMDTVQPGEGILPIIEDGVIRSSGDTILGGDNKAAICAILEALCVISENGLNRPALTIVFTVAEEGGLRGAKALDIREINADFGFLLDASGPVGMVVNRAPAQNHLKAVIRGRAAHAGICPEQGVSAIKVAAEAIMRTRLGRIDSETTANIGLISGGEGRNIVPEQVVLEGEARSVNVQKLKNQTQHMIENWKRVAAKWGAHAEIECVEAYPAINLAEDDPVVQLAARALGNIGLTPQVRQTGGGSDANVFNGKGLTTVNLASGMEKIHTTQEYIRIKDLVDLTRLILEITNLAQG